MILPPCIIPWPFRSFCPSRLLGYERRPDIKIRERRTNSIFASPAQGNVVPLSKELIQGITPKPTLGGETAGSVFVSIGESRSRATQDPCLKICSKCLVDYWILSAGREDSFSDAVDGGPQCNVQPREVRTTGWVVVRFTPRPSGVRSASRSKLICMISDDLAAGSCSHTRSRRSSFFRQSLFS